MAASGKVAERTSLGDLANVLDNPARLGLVERDTAPPARAASTKAKKTSKARAKGRKAVVGRHTQSGPARGGKAGGNVRNPWKRYIPCLTGGTQLAMRRRQGNDTIFKHLHPLEAFQMNGWHLNAWKQTEVTMVVSP